MMPLLKQHIWKLIGIGEAAANKLSFQRSFARVFGDPKEEEQGDFEFEDDKSKL